MTSSSLTALGRRASRRLDRWHGIDEGQPCPDVGRLRASSHVPMAQSMRRAARRVGGHQRPNQFYRQASGSEGHSIAPTHELQSLCQLVLGPDLLLRTARSWSIFTVVSID